jgi:hypothetical protein
MLLGKTAISIGSPLMPVGKEVPRWVDPAWQRSRLRKDCRLFSVDLSETDPIPKPRFCSPEMDTPTGRILRGGHLLASGTADRVFAVLEALPKLFVLNGQGEVLKEVSFLEPGESWPRFTAADEAAHTTSDAMPLELRSRLPWCVGLLRWKGAVGLVFRLWDPAKRESRFVVDLFDEQGAKLANDLDLGLESGDFWTLLRPMNGPKGKAYVLRTERSGYKAAEVLSQKLFEIQLDRGGQGSASKAAAQGLTFELRDLVSGSPIPAVQARFQMDERGTRDESQAEDGRHFLKKPAPRGVDADSITTAVLTLDADGYLPLSFPVDLAPPGDLGRIFLDPGITVEGTLLDAATGLPVRDGRVIHIRRHDWGALAADYFGYHDTAVPDAEGRFRLTGLEPGEACLRFEAAGQPSQALLLSALEPQEERQLGTVFVEGKASVRGQVVDADGDPLDESAVELRATSLRSPCVRLQAEVDADGRFSFPAVAPGNYWFGVFRRQQLVASQKVEVRAGRNLDLGEVAASLIDFRGRLQLQGAPLAQGYVALAEAQGAEFLPSPIFISQGAGKGQKLVSDIGSTVGTNTDIAGSFQAEGFLPPGDAWLTVTTAEGTVLRFPFQIPPDGRKVVLDHDFQGEEGHGWVIDEQGDRISGATVSLLQAEAALISAVTDEAGEFRLPALPTGDFVLEARKKNLLGRQPYRVSAEEAPTVEILVEARQSRELLVVPADASAGASSRSVVLVTDGKRIHVVRDLDRAEVFEGLPPAVYKVLAYGHGAIEAGPQVDLRWSRTAEVRFDGAEALPVSLRVAGELAGRTVQLETEDGFSLAPLLSRVGQALEVDPEGRVALPALTRGTWRVAYHDGRRFRQQTFRVQGQDETVIDLR